MGVSDDWWIVNNNNGYNGILLYDYGDEKYTTSFESVRGNILSGGEEHWL